MRLPDPVRTASADKPSRRESHERIAGTSWNKKPFHFPDIDRRSDFKDAKPRNAVAFVHAAVRSRLILFSTAHAIVQFRSRCTDRDRMTIPNRYIFSDFIYHNRTISAFVVLHVPSRRTLQRSSIFLCFCNDHSACRLDPDPPMLR